MPTLYHSRNQAYVDADKDISHQVLNRERQHIASMSQVSKPNSAIDDITSLNVEKAIESLAELMNSKVASLEAILGRTGRNAPQYILNEKRYLYSYLDVVRLYNNIIRIYKQLTSNFQTREYIKTKLQDISQYVNALIVGYENVIAKTDDNALINPLGMYKLIKKQLDSSSFDLIRDSDLRFATRDAVLDMTQEARNKMINPPLLNVDEYNQGIEQGSENVRREALMKQKREKLKELRKRLNEIQEAQAQAQAQAQADEENED